jgi:hypothetical protein
VSEFLSLSSLCVLVFKDIVLPTINASLTNQLAETQKEKTDLQNKFLKLELVSLEQKTQIAADASTIGDLKEQVKTLKETRFFSSDSLYPTEFARVRIGDPASSILSVYGEKSVVRRDDGFWSAEVDHPLISRVTYYFEERDRSRRVYQVLFQINWRSESERGKSLQDRLLDSFGQPTTNPKENYFMWRRGNVSLYKNDSGFIVMAANHAPNNWPTK